jgi:anti-sigma regulatory factor (Ser/Thr protein kinase)/GAF domain-containing protein
MSDHDDRDWEAAVSTSEGQDLAQALVDLSDTLVDGFDIVEFLHTLAGRCVGLLGVQAAGIMIADHRRVLRVMASSSEQARLLELFEVETDEGPCVACYTSATAVVEPDLDTPDPRWQRFAGRARQAGFRAVHAIPVRLRDDVIGVLNLFSTSPGSLDPASAQAARALANVTTLGLLQHRALDYREVLAEEVQHAMNSRSIIEQAKGVLAELLDLDMAAAFTELRRYAARAGRRLSDTAAAVTAADFAAPGTGPPGQLRVLLIRRFDEQTISRLRIAVRGAATRHGLPSHRTDPFVLAVHEAVTNAVRHGGGTGQLLLWLHADIFYAEVSDHGHGLPVGYRTIPTLPGDALNGTRGLWLINKVCAALDIDTGASGTRLLLHYPRHSSGSVTGIDPSGG